MTCQAKKFVMILIWEEKVVGAIFVDKSPIKKYWIVITIR